MGPDHPLYAESIGSAIVALSLAFLCGGPQAALIVGAVWFVLSIAIDLINQ